MEDMVGKWKLEKRDPNFEEFLICRQVNIGTLRDHLTLLTPGCEGWVVSEEADDQHHCGHRIQAQ